MTQFFTEVVCLECHKSQVADVMSAACSHCGSPWLDARYDYDAVKKHFSAQVPKRDLNLWRYQELLPLEPTIPELLMGEGCTPLTRLQHYENLYDHQAPIYIKDERNQPTNSFKARQAALSVMALAQHGIKECVLASTGNAAVAYAAYCARAGIKLWLFLTSLVPPEKMRECAIYGAEVVKVSGTYDETKKVAAEFAKRKDIHIDRGAKAIPGKESMKTLAFEIAEQLGLIAHPDDPHKWQAPDWYIQAVSGGIGPLGVWKGFEELLALGLTDKMPKLGICQAAGCSPMVDAFVADQETATPVTPKTLITVLATGDPGFGYVQLRHAAKSNGGAMVAIEDGETFRAMRHAASRAGISVEPATAVAFAGMEKMLSEGIIAPDESVVLNCSGHTFPVESHILGDQYERYILDLTVERDGFDQPLPQLEGLGSALERLDEQVTTIVVIDDNPHDRRLIRRLLQSYKLYRVYEARNGKEGLHVIQDRKPDLVVLDLTMPEMDGFELLNILKNDPQTANIPVVIVSAKALTSKDRQLLSKRTASIWTKGGLNTQKLVEHVVETLGHRPLEVIQHEPKTIEIEQSVIPDEDVIDENAHVIVVIDDNPHDLRLARRTLQSGGNFHVIEAETGRDGLKAIYNYHPDLAIVDLILPDMDGFSIIETLQKDPNLLDIPIIVYSAKDLTMDERERIQERIRLFINKLSLDRKQFLKVVKGELE